MHTRIRMGLRPARPSVSVNDCARLSCLVFLTIYLCSSAFRFHKAASLGLVKTHDGSPAPLNATTSAIIAIFSFLALEDIVLVAFFALSSIVILFGTKGYKRGILLIGVFIAVIVNILVSCAEHTFFLTTGTLLQFEMIENAIDSFGSHFAMGMALSELSTARYLLLCYFVVFFILLVIQNEARDWCFRIDPLNELDEQESPAPDSAVHHLDQRNRTRGRKAKPNRRKKRKDQRGSCAMIQGDSLPWMLAVMGVALLLLVVVMPSERAQHATLESALQGSVPLRMAVAFARSGFSRFFYGEARRVSTTTPTTQHHTTQEEADEDLRLLVLDDQDEEGKLLRENEEDIEDEEAEIPKAPYHTKVTPILSHNTDNNNNNDNKTRTSPKKNVVVVVLESTRPEFCTPYYESSHSRFFPPSMRSGPINVTPFLNRLSKHAIRGDAVYTTSSYTVKSLVSIFCGIYPAPTRSAVEDDAGLYATCMPDFLRQQGYATGFFMSAAGSFDRMSTLMPLMLGFEDFFDTAALWNRYEHHMSQFQKVGYLGEEDRAMVKPILKYVDEKRAAKQPFMVGYLTTTSHHPFELPTNFAQESYVTTTKKQNSYMNTLRYADEVIEKLFQGFEERKLMDDTLFVIIGDHGIGFLEHQISGVLANPFDEAFRVPFFLYGSSITQALRKNRIEGFLSSLDVFPTVLDHLFNNSLDNNNNIHNNMVVTMPPEYEGRSVLREEEDGGKRSKENRCIFSQCSPAPHCKVIRCWPLKVMLLKDGEVRAFDLEKDPHELHPLKLAVEGGVGVETLRDTGESVGVKRRVERMVDELKKWAKRVRGYYRKALLHNDRYELEARKEMWMSEDYQD